MKKQKRSEENGGFFAVIGKAMGDYAKANPTGILVFALCFAALSLINFFCIAAVGEIIKWRPFFNSEIYLFFVILLWFFLFVFASEQSNNKRLSIKEAITFNIGLTIIYFLSSLCNQIPFFSDNHFMLPLMIPSALLVILTTIIFGRLISEIFAFIIFLVVLDANLWDLVPALFVLVSCYPSIHLAYRITRRTEMVLLSLILAAVDLIGMTLLTVVFNGTFAHSQASLVGATLNGFFSGTLALGLITPLEIVLNTASVFRLLDLSDLNTPLFQRFMLDAPGTYSHSQMVANLAETACRDIHAHDLLARVGSYYHDIGKMEQPEYFTENQTGANKHADINPRLSASVIKSHVKKGVEKCRALHLPQAVIDIVSEHHGNSIIAYFYAEAQKADSAVSAEEFCYPGNPPTSRESAVVMLADTAEAACRSLEKPTAQRLEKFIAGLVAQKVEHHQLDNCDLTFRDLDTITKSFVRILAAYYHSRIEYPDQKDPDSE
jgi:putative nucleotidyltransferase with HDIG domain